MRLNILEIDGLIDRVDEIVQIALHCYSKYCGTYDTDEFDLGGRLPTTSEITRDGVHASEGRLQLCITPHQGLLRACSGAYPVLSRD